MKQKFLQANVLFFLLLSSVTVKAQITITADDFLRMAEFTDTIYRSTASNPVDPEEGTDMMWDYSDLQIDELVTIEYYDATNDPDLPNALNVKIQDLIFQGFIIEADGYEGIDNQGWYDLGRYTYDVAYGISAITGDPTDSLYFPESAEEYEGRIDLIKFPTSYPDQWTESRKENIYFELTVAAFGLNKTPGIRQRTVTQDREITGYGKLILPYPDGSPTLPIDVLMVKRTETELDSVFLGGAPAPAALLNAFGLVQGTSSSVTSYLFYTTDFAAPLFSYDVGNDFLFYRPQGAPILSSAHELIPGVTNNFPNPIQAGELLNITTEESIVSGDIVFIDIMGRQVFQTSFKSAGGNQLQVKIPALLAKGMYSYKLLDEKSTPQAIGKILIN